MSKTSIVVVLYAMRRWSYVRTVGWVLHSTEYSVRACERRRGSRHNINAGGCCVRATRMCSVPRVWVVGWTRRYVTSLPTVQNLGVGQWTLSHTAGAKLGSLSFRAPNDSVHFLYYNPFWAHFESIQKRAMCLRSLKIQLLFGKNLHEA